jgi:hypothetical protein
MEAEVDPIQQNLTQKSLIIFNTNACEMKERQRTEREHQSRGSK